MRKKTLLFSLLCACKIPETQSGFLRVQVKRTTTTSHTQDANVNKSNDHTLRGECAAEMPQHLWAPYRAGRIRTIAKCHEIGATDMEILCPDNVWAFTFVIICGVLLQVLFGKIYGMVEKVKVTGEKGYERRASVPFLRDQSIYNTFLNKFQAWN